MGEDDAVTHARQPVVVVDDDPSFLEVMQLVLESGGYRVIALAPAADVVARIRKHRPRLIVTDLLMQPIVGLQVIAALAADAATAALPKILWTAAWDEADRHGASLREHCWAVL